MNPKQNLLGLPELVKPYFIAYPLSSKMAEANQTQLARNKANAAKLILYPRRMDSGDL
jgi:hypothetical protein